MDRKIPVCGDILLIEISLMTEDPVKSYRVFSRP